MMDQTRKTQADHDIKMFNRKELEISGVKEVDSFDSEEFLLQTEMGYMIIRGSNLHMKNLDLQEGKVSIKGKIQELSYLDEHNGEKAKGIFSKLFK
ncbi:sporulation protein YabP [Terribacillus saccharophilus]|uniref:Sporulation protein YabP n=2 Tax=Terribacillus saccharophilus TaxID=361277 RepID=A0A268A6H6_9BACI|nr:sporulation protein YabP [Terribacillus saccharophilus]PAD19728.1 sporulation protein YabP [Terribacillus saccharophilus]PAF16150.1 sporulation protein YabP [Terribacillus saccharophilus]PAF20117.1 sporulation protein YabP [Terribacillus saccharophilus]PAF34581.1 sporulation protein YabP [Terribacillus saccharophilus]PAF35155.1 sporulation protein YabP [Terribacillus saccharophilus]